MKLIDKKIAPFEEIENIPPIIYKYRDWQDDYQVFFAEPKSFKDPEDCKNPIRYDLLSTREIYEKYLTDSHKINRNFTKEQHALLVFSKLEKWQYEQEYRTHKFHINPLRLEDRQVTLPPESYKELIFGANMTDESIQDVKSNIPDNLHHMDLKRAGIQENEILIEEYE